HRPPRRIPASLIGHCATRTRVAGHNELVADCDDSASFLENLYDVSFEIPYDVNSAGNTYRRPRSGSAPAAVRKLLAEVLHQLVNLRRKLRDGEEVQVRSVNVVHENADMERHHLPRVLHLETKLAPFTDFLLSEQPIYLLALPRTDDRYAPY